MSNGSELVGEQPNEVIVGELKDFLGGGVRRLLLVPYAAVVRSYDESAALARARFGALGYEVESVHETQDARAAVALAEAVVIHGGNTFALLKGLYANNLLGAIRARAEAGTPYVGWSAGANVACPTIRTTNDMPVVEPPSFAALALVPFQINPHYTDRALEGHHGETRDERLAEFVHANPGVHVVGLREGTSLRVEDSGVKLVGDAPARIFL
ncbi:MAG TPA: dipeptidase PepE, partial [Pyrinomonadaceae bacterium]